MAVDPIPHETKKDLISGPFLCLILNLWREKDIDSLSATQQLL